MFANILAMGASTTGTPAAGAPAQGGGGGLLVTLLPFGVIILIFYFLIIRPQKKKDKETKNMLASMKKGDKVVSIGGIHGTVAIVKETTVVVKVDDNTRMEFSKNAISAILDKKPDKRQEPESKGIEKVAAPKKRLFGAAKADKADQAAKPEQGGKADKAGKAAAPEGDKPAVQPAARPAGEAAKPGNEADEQQ